MVEITPFTNQLFLIKTIPNTKPKHQKQFKNSLNEKYKCDFSFYIDLLFMLLIILMLYINIMIFSFTLYILSIIRKPTKSLINTDTGLYIQSASYIYEYLKEEIGESGNKHSD